jgi:hypothetical protein
MTSRITCALEKRSVCAAFGSTMATRCWPSPLPMPP